MAARSAEWQCKAGPGRSRPRGEMRSVSLKAPQATFSQVN